MSTPRPFRSIAACGSGYRWASVGARLARDRLYAVYLQYRSAYIAGKPRSYRGMRIQAGWAAASSSWV
ncbi:GF22728 [Pseudomonas chlororaphis subsp. aurantiaca]|nr:GF22728 [Pseudomonas chlororaphis subsp. aurantiaca]